MAENGILDYQGMNQAIYRGATSNIVVDTQSMSIEIGAGNTSHTSNLHFECNHDANVASIKLNSNVVTEFPRSKKLIKYPRVAMTQNDESGTSGYVASANSEYPDGTDTNYHAFRVFNNSGPAKAYVAGVGWEPANIATFGENGIWGGTNASGASTDSSANTTMTLEEGNTIYGEWLQIQLPTKIRLEYVNFSPISLYGGTHDFLGAFRSPRAGYILGSNNGTNWTTLKNWSGLDYDTWVAHEHTFYKFDIDKEVDNYQYFRFVWTETASGSGSSYSRYASCQELEFWGVPEYDPTAYGADVTLKSKANVPNTDWLEVYYDAKNFVSGSVTVQDETSNNRDAEMNATFDNGEIKAFNFTGAHTSNVTTSDHGLGTGDVTYTVSYWFKRTQRRNNYDYLYIAGSGGSTGQASLMWINSEKLHLDHWGTATKHDEPIQNNRWYHVAAGHKGGPAVTNDFLYVDGQKVGVAISPPATFNLQGTKLTLGTSHNTTNEFLEGSIANFRLFNRALTSDEIYQLYAHQKEYFGHSTNNLTLKAGRLGIGTSEPRAALDVYGELYGPRTKPCFSIHTDAYWTANYNSWGSDSSSHWVCLYRTPIPFVPRDWLEHDSHGAISFTDVTRGSNTGTIVKFTAPRSGFYHFSFNIGFKSSSASDYVGFMLNKNDTSVSSGSVTTNDYFLGSVHTPSNTALAVTINSSVNFYLNKGEFVVPYSRSVNKSYVADGGGFSFSGFYIG